MEMNMSKLTGIALATAVAGLFSVVSAPAFAGSGNEAKMECPHSSSCKGQGSCKSAQNSCKGQNACKGQGMTMQDDAAACVEAQKASKKE